MSLVEVRDNGDIKVSVETPQEAKLAIKELRLKKKEYALAKKEVAAQMQQVRADYRSRVADRGSKLRGGGGLGRLVRGVQTIHRDADRRTVDDEIRPLEARRADIDDIMNQIDSAIIQLERFALQNQ